MATKLATVEQIIEAGDGHRILNIAQRIAAVMGEVDYVQKDPKKQGMQYSYASHDKVTARVRPLLHKHGIVYYPRDLTVKQDGNRTEAVFTVRFENIDDRADFIDVATFGYGVDPQDKGPGKAMSYGVKYALLKALGLETGDEAEAEQGPAADHVPARTPTAKSLATDEQLATIKDLAGVAGVSEKALLEAGKVASLADLTLDRATDFILRLERTIKEKRS